MAVAELLICPASDPTGTPIETWTDQDFLDLKLEISLNDLGKNSVKIPRGLWEGSALDARESYYARVNVPYIEAANPFWGFWLIGGQFILVDERERGGEDVTIGGPGPAYILTKAILNHEQWTPNAGVEVSDGKWYFKGKNYGQILNDLINEDAASNHPALDDMETPGWDNTNDVDGNPWEEFGGIFAIPVGTNYLDVIRELQKGDKLDVWVTPKLNLRAFVAYGRDLSGNSYGAGVVRFVGSEVTPAENRNIIGQLVRHKDGGHNFTHVLVLGNDRRENGHVIEGSPIHKWVTDPDWSPGDAVHQGFLDYDTNSRVILERAGQRLIRRSKDRSGRMLECEIMPGQDEANGLYLPGDGSTDRGNYWIGDTVTFKTGGGDDFDLFNRDLVIAKIRMQLDVAASDANNAAKGLSWRTWIETGDDIKPSSSAASSKNNIGGGGNRDRLLLCETVIGCRNLAPADLTNETDTNGDAENASGTQWSGGSGYNTTYKHGGARSYARLAATSADISYDFGSQLFTAGTRYVLDFWRRQTFDHDATTITFGDANGDEETKLYAGSPGADPVDLWEEDDTGADGGTWNRGRICWTPAADRTNVRLRFQPTAFGSSDFAIDDLALYSTTAGDENVGTDNRAARCDHLHLIETLTTAETDTSLRLAPDGSGGVEWSTGGSGGAPTTADYLVGTAQGGLSAEIVVGTTPGGELGGTWASPTVDVTHSGSAHHAESHESRHQDGGADEIDITTLGGYSGNSSQVLLGDGTFASPPAAGAGDFSGLTTERRIQAVSDYVAAYDSSAADERGFPVGSLGMSRQHTVIETDMAHPESGTLANLGALHDAPLVWQFTGNGAAPARVDSVAGRIGLMSVSTGVSATGRCGLSSAGDIAILGGGKVRFMGIGKLNTLSTGTERYGVYMGLGNAMGGTAQASGVGFRYTDNVNGGEWQGVTTSASVESTLDTNVAADTNYHVWEFEVNAAASSVEFWIDGTSVGTLSANIPSVVMRLIAWNMVKTIGLTARLSTLDAFQWVFEYTTAR